MNKNSYDNNVYYFNILFSIFRAAYIGKELTKSNLTDQEKIQKLENDILSKFEKKVNYM